MYKSRWERSLVIKAISFVLVFLACVANDAQAITKVAIIDSGVNPFPGIRLCDTGHYDFINNMNIVGTDVLKHGTHVAEAITYYAGNSDYCLLIYKIYKDGGNYKDYISQAIQKAIRSGADIINLSVDSNRNYIDDEHNWLRVAGVKGINIFLAAGNGSKDLDKKCNIYPVCYKKVAMTVVGNREAYSNYGKIVDQFESGCFNGFCGTSASVAIATGKFINHMKLHQQCVDEYKQCMKDHGCNSVSCPQSATAICRDDYKKCEGK